MTSIKFTATIIRKDKGQYFARADEVSITAETAATKRGAIKQLKVAVTELLRDAGEDGKLPALLGAAGYLGFLSNVSGITLECNILDSVSLFVPLPRQSPHGAAKEYTPAQRHAIDRGIAQSMKEYKQGKAFGPFDTHAEFITSLHGSPPPASFIRISVL